MAIVGCKCIVMARPCHSRFVTKRLVGMVVIALSVWCLLWRFKFQSQSTPSVLPQAFLENVYPVKPLMVNYTIIPWTMTQDLATKGKKFIIFFVKSAPDHFLRRETIRHTWGGITRLGSKNIAVVFVIGAASDSSINRHVKRESGCHGDILQSNVMDSFRNLTVKTLAAFRWITDHLRAKSDFYVVTDDDCVINLYNTVYFLAASIPARSEEKQLMYCGFMYERGSGVIRGSGKLSVQRSQYASDFFPSFCRGVMVVLTYKMIADLYAVSQVTHYDGFPLEDAMVYGILREKLNERDSNIYPVINGGHSLVSYPWDHTSGVVDKMKLYWKNLETKLHPSLVSRQRVTNKVNCFIYDFERKRRSREG